MTKKQYAQNNLHLTPNELFQKIYNENKELCVENKKLVEENKKLSQKISYIENSPSIKELLRLKEIEKKYDEEQWLKYVNGGH